MLMRRRGLGVRADKILHSRHSNCTHYDACRDSASVPRDTQKCEQQEGRLSGRFRLRAYRTVQPGPVSSRSEPRGFPRRLFLYPVPSACSAAARTAPNGVKERASFCLVFRSLNTTSSHRMFSMGNRRAKSTQGNTNFQKRIFWQTTSGSLPAGLKTSCLIIKI